jgi:hypothetical protein
MADELPPELWHIIFNYCDTESLEGLKLSPSFKSYHKNIDIYLDKRTREYWNDIQTSHMYNIMSNIMVAHTTVLLERTYWVLIDETTNKILKDWYDSDVKIFNSMKQMKTDKVIRYFENQRIEFQKKYPGFTELISRPLIFNRLMLASFSRNDIVPQRYYEPEYSS